MYIWMHTDINVHHKHTHIYTYIYIYEIELKNLQLLKDILSSMINARKFA